MLLKEHFGGSSVQQIKSRDCDHISEKEESFYVINCEVKNKKNVEEMTIRNIEIDESLMIKGRRVQRCIRGPRTAGDIQPSGIDSKADSLFISVADLGKHDKFLGFLSLLGAGFGVGIALTLSRLLAGLARGLNPWLLIAGAVACAAAGLAATLVVVNIRGLLHDRALLDRWAGDATSSLRSVVEELVATRVLRVDSVLSTALTARDEAENTQVGERVSAIDSELREHAIAAARAAAVRDREMPTLRAALDAVRAELGEPGIPETKGRVETASQVDAGIGEIDESTSRSPDGDDL